MRIVAVVVIYNRKLSDSPSYNRCVEFKAQHKLTLVVCDNSERQIQDSVTECDFYIKMKGNEGISRAFNEGIEKVRQVLPDSVFVLLDQDTEFPAEYFDIVYSEFSLHSTCQMVVPLVFDSKGLLSPCKMSVTRMRRFRDHRVAQQSTSRTSFINSGMAIRGNVFDFLKFCENLFLDYVDHKFVSDFKEIFGYSCIHIVSVKFQQDFSGTSRAPLETKRHRFRIFLSDYNRFFLVSGGNRVSLILNLFARTLLLVIKFGSFAFLFDLISFFAKRK